MAKGLGKGLGALIPTATKQGTPAVKAEEVQVSASNGPQEISLDLIQPNPDQPRKHFDPFALEELTESIKQHGILQPLVVTPAGTDKKHTLIAGERRFRAAKLLGLKKVPVLVRDLKEQEQMEVAVVENVQRADLNPVEEARAYERLMGEFNLTQEEVAKRVGKSRSGIANTLRLLDLPTEIQDAVADGKMSMGHAKVLASLDSPQHQEDYAKQVLEKGLSVRELEQAAKKIRKRKTGSHQSFDPIREAQEEMLRDRLGTKVVIKKSGDKGQIQIFFHSLEDLKRLLNELS